MKKQINFLKMLIGLAFLILGMTSCSTENIPEGNKGLCIKRPYIFGSDGVEVLEPGRHTIAWTSNIVVINTQPSKITESFNDLTPKDDTPVDFEIYFNIQKDENRLDYLYSKFGLEFYIHNLQQEFRELTRNKCKNYDMKTLTNNEQASKEICDYIFIEGNKIIKNLGIPVVLKSVNMGGVNPPDEVTKERCLTAAAKQREFTQIEETKNQIERQNTERERAKADKAYQNALNISTEQYIRLQELKVKEVGYAKAKDITIIEGNANLLKTIK